MTTDAKPPTCTNCGKPITVLVKRRIFDRDWDPRRRKQVVREREMDFCSDACGGSYQSGCEG